VAVGGDIGVFGEALDFDLEEASYFVDEVIFEVLNLLWGFWDRSPVVHVGVDCLFFFC